MVSQWGDLDGLPTSLLVLFSRVLGHEPVFATGRPSEAAIGFWSLCILLLLILPQLHTLAVNFSPLCILSLEEMFVQGANTVANVPSLSLCTV